MEKKIGFIGIGTTGKLLAAHLIKVGHDVTIYNRTKSKCDDLIEMGAHWCSTPEDVAQNSQILFTMLGFPQDVEEVYFGDHGLLQGVTTGTILVDMTTSDPKLAQKIYEAAKKKGASALDSPIEGDDLAPRNKTLTFLVGGDELVFEEIHPLLSQMGSNVHYMGPAGSGQATKISNQILIANTMIGVVESLQFACKHGLDLEKVIEAIGKGTASSWSINNLGRRMIAKKYNTGFFIKHFVKDMRIALEAAERMHLSLPGLSLVHQFYLIAMNMGMENMGYQAIYQVFAKMNNIEC